jgi:hypothetical protein
MKEVPRHFRRATLPVLRGVLNVMEAFSRQQDQCLSLNQATLEYYSAAEHGNRNLANVVRECLHYAPLLLVSMHNGHSNFCGPGLINRAFIKRPDATGLQAIEVIVKQLRVGLDVQWAQDVAQVAAVPIDSYRSLVSGGGLQAREVLEAAMAEILGKRKLAKYNSDVSLKSLRRHCTQSEAALKQLPSMHADVVKEIERKAQVSANPTCLPIDSQFTLIWCRSNRTSSQNWSPCCRGQSALAKRR